MHFSRDLTGFQICFSTGKYVNRVHGPLDRYSGWSTVDHGHGRAARSPVLSARLPQAIGICRGMMERKRDSRGSSPRVANDRGAMECGRR
jgi:hypothetical protein